MEDFIESRGLPFMPHVLRRLHDHFVKSAAEWYDEIGVVAPPRTHSTMLALSEGPLGLTEIASLLHQSHPLVLTWVRQLKNLGFVESAEDPDDGRRNVLSLTQAGRNELEKHGTADRIFGLALQRLMREADAEVFDPLWRLEKACRSIPFSKRLQQETVQWARAAAESHDTT